MVGSPDAILEKATVHIAVTEEITGVAGNSDIAARLAWINAAFHLIHINTGQACNAA